MVHAPHAGANSTIPDSVSSRRALREPQALTPVRQSRRGATHGVCVYFVFDNSVSGTARLAERTHTVTGGCARARRDVTRPPRFEMKELGEVTMVSMAHLADAFRELPR
jgi:hypothetical protein